MEASDASSFAVHNAHPCVSRCPSLQMEARTETTTFVKVKSHSGVPLNEAADVLAEMGTESPDFMCEYDSQGAKLTPFTCHGEVIPNLNSFLREAQADVGPSLAGMGPLATTVKQFKAYKVYWKTCMLWSTGAARGSETGINEGSEVRPRAWTWHGLLGFRDV